MANWLEEEEHKRDLLRQEEELLRQREALVHTHLGTLYNLCDRVNGVKPRSLSIDRLTIIGLRSYTIEWRKVNNGGVVVVKGTRSIRFSPQPDAITFCDAVINEDKQLLSNDGNASWNLEIVVLRTTCSLHDLTEWREDQILNSIQWMMLESETIKGNVPGIQVTTKDVDVAEGPLTGADSPAQLPVQLPSHGRVILWGNEFMTEHAAALAEAEARHEAEKSARRRKEYLAEQDRRKANCFVATAAYGARDPNVMLLRAYRDRILSKTFIGRSAIRFYYLASPPLARFIVASGRRRSKARVLLTPFLLRARRELDRLGKPDA